MIKLVLLSIALAAGCEAYPRSGVYACNAEDDCPHDMACSVTARTCTFASGSAGIGADDVTPTR